MIRYLPTLIRWIIGRPSRALVTPTHNPLRLVSFWLLVAAIALYIVQLSPVPGVLLMVFGGPFLVGILLQAALIALFVEAVSGRTSRYLALVPIAAYAAYYVWFAFDRVFELRGRARLSAGLASVGRFDPATESLVSNDAVFFAQNYDVDVVYKNAAGPDQPVTLGYRLIEGLLCKRLRETRLPRGAHVHVAVWTANPRERWSKDAPTLCVVGVPEDPPLRAFAVEQNHPREDESNDSGASFHVELDKQPAVELSIRYGERLSWLPFPYAGCALDDAASRWKCSRGFLRIPQGLDGPYGTQMMQAEGRLAEAIGLRRRGSDLDIAQRNTALVRARVEELVAAAIAAPPPTEAAPASAQAPAPTPVLSATQPPHPSSAPAAAGFDPVATIQRKIDDPMAELVDPPNVDTPVTRHAVAAAQERWAPQAERLAAAFIALAQVRPAGGTTRLLAMALVALPPTAYRGLSDGAVERLTGLLQRTPLQWGGLFYERLADAGPRTLAFYRQRLIDSRHGAAGPETAQALCRLQDRDLATREELRRRYLLNLQRAQPTPAGALRLSAFFEALLASDDASFVREHPPRLDNPQVQGWFDQLLSGQAAGPGGPNNCRPIVLPVEAMPPTWETIIAWKDGSWGPMAH